MINHDNSCTQHQMKIRIKTDKEQNECSMAYEEAVELINDYSSETLEAIKAAHSHLREPS